MQSDACPELAIVTPIYNEAANIATVIDEWMQALRQAGVSFQFLAVNDGSRDATLEILNGLARENPENLVVIDKPNSGHGRSCRRGYEEALSRGAEWVLQIDSDGQCDPAYFPEFWKLRHEADCVFGLRKTRGDGLARKVISVACSFLSRIVAGVNLRDANVPFRMMRREALAGALARVPADFDVQNIALTVALKRNPALRWGYVPIHFRDRQGGTNSIDIPKIAKMGWQMLWDLKRVK